MCILIVEDDPMIALVLEQLISDVVKAEIVVTDTVAEAMRMQTTSIEFALLDVDVTNGKTFQVAQRLLDAHVPFTFVTGARPDEVPAQFSGATWVAKPFSDAEIHEAVREMRTAA